MSSHANSIRDRIKALRSGEGRANEPIGSSEDQNDSATEDQQVDMAALSMPHACAHIRTMHHDELSVEVVPEAAEVNDAIVDLGQEGEIAEEAVPETMPGLSLKRKVMIAIGVTFLTVGSGAAWYLASAVGTDKGTKSPVAALLPPPPRQVQLVTSSVHGGVAVQQLLSSNKSTVVNVDSPSLQLPAAQPAQKAAMKNVYEDRTGNVSETAESAHRERVPPPLSANRSNRQPGRVKQSRKKAPKESSKPSAETAEVLSVLESARRAK